MINLFPVHKRGTTLHLLTVLLEFIFNQIALSLSYDPLYKNLKKTINSFEWPIFS